MKDGHLIEGLPEQAVASHKYIQKRVEELLHESDLTQFMDNYALSSTTGQKFTETHKVQWKLVIEALRTTADPEARNKAIVGIYNYKFNYRKKLTSQITEAMEINTDIHPREMIVQGKIVGQCEITGEKNNIPKIILA